MSAEVDTEKTFNLANGLGDAFIWDKTPQGNSFWLDISHKLREIACNALHTTKTEETN